MNLHYFFIGIVFLLTQSLYAQQETISVTDNRIEAQFDVMVEKSSTWEKYKVIEKTKLYAFKKNILDSLKAHQQTLLEKSNKIVQNEIKINQLNNQIEHLHKDLEILQNQKDSIHLAGLSLNKGLYQILVWGIILTLLGLLGLYIFRFYHANIVTKKSLKEFEELRYEFEEHKKRSIEREEKVRRQLQDEINKNKGI